MKTQWQVKIPVGSFMCGIHTFKTKKAALGFQAAWANANRLPNGDLVLHGVKRLY